MVATAHEEVQKAAVAHLDEPTIAIGDVAKHVPTRRFLPAGFDDAAGARTDTAGRLTFSANRRYSPLVAIDHALISRQPEVVSIEAFGTRINEHLGLVVHMTRFVPPPL